jgi:hypothetical protein
LVNSTSLQSLATTPALFMDCVVLHYLWIFTEEGMEYVTGGEETGDSGNETSASSDGEASEGEADTAGATSASLPTLYTAGSIVCAALVMIASEVIA